MKNETKDGVKRQTTVYI